MERPIVVHKAIALTPIGGLGDFFRVPCVTGIFLSLSLSLVPHTDSNAFLRQAAELNNFSVTLIISVVAFLGR